MHLHSRWSGVFRRPQILSPLIVLELTMFAGVVHSVAATESGTGPRYLVQ